MARTREPRERVQVEALDFAKVDPRIAERISVRLAQTAFRLPGHVLIRNANPTQFRLTESLPKVPIPVQIARKRFPKPQAAS
jgi:hypothetical protein